MTFSSSNTVVQHSPVQRQPLYVLNKLTRRSVGLWSQSRATADMKRFRSSLGVAAAAVSFASALSPIYRHGQGAVLPKYSDEPLKNISPPSLLLDGSTTGSWDGPALHDGTPTRLYSLSLGRVWHNYTENAELTTTVDEHKAARRSWQGRRSLYLSMEDTPLFPGWGTHFAYIYAGTPPQRVSVIVDTGSHFTAFPCSECRSCGSHTDPYWDHRKSSTSNILSCQSCHGSFRYRHGAVRGKDKRSTV